MKSCLLIILIIALILSGVISSYIGVNTYTYIALITGIIVFLIVLIELKNGKGRTKL